MTDYEMHFTASGLPDPVPAGAAYGPLPRGLWGLAGVALACTGAEAAARLGAGPFLLFGRGAVSAVCYFVFAPLVAGTILRRTPRLRSSAYIFLTLQSARAVKAAWFPSAYSLPPEQALVALSVAAGFIVYLQLPGVVQAVPRLNARDMKNRLMQRFQRTLNG